MKYRKATYKYQLAGDEVFTVNVLPSHDIETEFIKLTASGSLTVKSGYAWDGCSGPTIDTPTNMRAGLAHDALYQLMREKHLDYKIFRKPADNVLKQVAIEDGMHPWRAAYFFWAVRRHAEFAAHPENVKKVYEAP